MNKHNYIIFIIKVDAYWTEYCQKNDNDDDDDEDDEIYCLTLEFT